MVDYFEILPKILVLFSQKFIKVCFYLTMNGLLQPSCRSLFVILQPKTRTERYVSNDIELKVL